MMAYRGNVAETEARKDKVRGCVIEIKRNLHGLSGVCITPVASNIIQAIFRLLDVIVEDETMEGLDN